MTFANIESLSQQLTALGASRIFCKALAENDNTKQQIYLGGSFEVIKLLPHHDVKSEPGVTRQNFKAAVKLAWVDDNGHFATAPGAQLILYPDYPEVRLSGFVRGCGTAPAKFLQPIPKESRKFNNGPDGRILFFGVSPEGMIYVYLAVAGSAVASEFTNRLKDGEYEADGVLWHFGDGRKQNAKNELLERLRVINYDGWHFSQRLNKSGQVIPYAARNGGGYTLESLLGIKPNSDAAPDFMGWEVKAYGGGKVTLMTPEPDAGYYGINGVEAFVRKYGHDAGNDVLYFTGIHRSGTACLKTGQTLRLRGFDAGKRKIHDVDGGIELVDFDGEVSAGWSYQGLIEHWGRKHAAAVYVRYDKKKAELPEYHYKSPVLMGEGTDFNLYLAAILDGLVMYDPGSKVMAASTKNSSVKARSQFRIPIRNLSLLYSKFESVLL